MIKLFSSLSFFFLLNNSESRTIKDPISEAIKHEPLPIVCILRLRANKGTVSDLERTYYLEIEEKPYTLEGDYIES